METTEEPRLDKRIWPARTAAWELLALSFRYPDDALADAVASGEWAEAAREIADVLGVSLSEDFGSSLSAASGVDGAGLHALRVEATRLFIGAPQPAVSPFEGVHRAEQDGVQALLFVNPHSMEVERFMKACGLGRPEGTNEPLDHVASECELLMYLSMRAAGAPVPDSAPQPEALPGGSAHAAYELFLKDHVRPWMPDFAEQVRAEAREPFFLAAAELLAAMVAA